MSIDCGMKRIAVSLLEFFAIIVAFFFTMFLSAILPLPFALLPLVVSLGLFVVGFAYFLFQIDWIISGFRGIPTSSGEPAEEVSSLVLSVLRYWVGKR